MVGDRGEPAVAVGEGGPPVVGIGHRLEQGLVVVGERPDLVVPREGGQAPDAARLLVVVFQFLVVQLQAVRLGLEPAVVGPLERIAGAVRGQIESRLRIQIGVPPAGAIPLDDHRVVLAPRDDLLLERHAPLGAVGAHLAARREL